MWELKACAICLRTKIKLLSMDVNNLRNDYKLVSGLKAVKGKGLPEHLCVVCVAYLQRFKKFREKCHRAHYTMIELLKKNKEISSSTLEALNLQYLDIAPSLSYLKLENVYYETCKFKWKKHNRSLLNSGEKIPVHHCSTIDPNVIFEVPLQPEVSDDGLVKEETITEGNSLIQETPLEDINDDLDATDHCDPEPETCEPILTDEEKPVNIEENNIEMLFDSIFGSSNKEDIDNSANAEINADEVTVEEVQGDVDGSQFEEEYATVSALSVQEIKAVVDIYKMFAQGKHKCKICSKSYMNEKRLNVHMRMHDIHTSGTFYCSLCSYYYKTEFLLKTHVADKHMYKYVCKKCPEVSFDKTSAKQHYIWTHLQKDGKGNSNWYEGNPRPQWMSMRGCKKPKDVLTLRPVRKNNKKRKDFPKQTAVPQLEQYQLIEERKNSRNYLESTFKCQLCYRGFRGLQTYSKHMKKHDPSQSGELQCDMCKLHFPSTRRMSKHMRVCHSFKYFCQLCDYVCYNWSSASMHYKFHKNVTFKCPHCDMVFNKMSTRLTHIRIKHPSTYICDLCGHSFVSDTGLCFHKKISHTAQEVEASGKATLETSDPLYCADCGIQFRSAEAYSTHFGSSAKHAATNISSKPKRAIVSRVWRRGRRGYASKDIVNNGMPTVNDCELCGEKLRNDVAARKHYESLHPGADFLKRYMCDICGHITKQYANLIVHMRTHTQEKPYSCPHCDRKFSMVSNRDRHLSVHTGEKRFQCQHCSRRFTQSTAVKLHIQTVHLKIPYAPRDKKNRKRRKELESAAPAALPLAHKYGDPGGDYLHAYINYNDE